MGRINLETRNGIIEMHKKGTPVSNIVQILTGVKRSSVYDLIRKYKETGSVADKHRIRPSKFNMSITYLK
jgi:transposase